MRCDYAIACRLETGPVDVILQTERSMAESGTNRRESDRDELNQEDPSERKNGTIVDTITLMQRKLGDEGRGEGRLRRDDGRAGQHTLLRFMAC